VLRLLQRLGALQQISFQTLYLGLPFKQGSLMLLELGLILSVSVRHLLLQSFDLLQ
jgi:hypothetical protein